MNAWIHYAYNVLLLTCCNHISSLHYFNCQFVHRICDGGVIDQTWSGTYACIATNIYIACMYILAIA